MEFALLADGKNFREEMAEVGIFHVDQSKTFNSRGVNNISAHLQWMHLREGGRVLPLIVAATNGARS